MFVINESAAYLQSLPFPRGRQPTAIRAEIQAGDSRQIFPIKVSFGGRFTLVIARAALYCADSVARLPTRQFCQRFDSVRFLKRARVVT